MKQVFQLISFLLRSFLCCLCGKSCKLHLPAKEHKKTATRTARPGRFTKTADGTYTNGKTADTAQILLLGDLLCQRKQQNAYRIEDGSFDFTPMLAPMEEMFRSADLTVGNLECICDDTLAFMHEQTTADGLPFLNAPEEFLHALKNAGVDAVCSANNHNCDGGKQGILQTLARLHEAELPVTGIFENENEKRYLMFNVNGIHVALLAYSAFYNFKSTSLSSAQRQTMLNLYRTKKAKRDIADAKQNGADFVIVYMHWGTEYTHRVSWRQRRMAKKLTNCGCDLIAGSHPHVLQAFEYENGVPCLYSFGNFISSQTKEGTQESVMLQITLQKENGKTVIADLCAIPCKTSVSENDTQHRAEPVSKKDDASTHANITDAIGNKIRIEEWKTLAV